MSVKSVLKGCHDALKTSAHQHNNRGDTLHVATCLLQAEAVLRLLAELDNEQQEETSDGPA